MCTSLYLLLYPQRWCFNSNLGAFVSVEYKPKDALSLVMTIAVDTDRSHLYHLMTAHLSWLPKANVSSLCPRVPLVAGTLPPCRNSGPKHQSIISSSQQSSPWSPIRWAALRWGLHWLQSCQWGSAPATCRSDLLDNIPFIPGLPSPLPCLGSWLSSQIIHLPSNPCLRVSSRETHTQPWFGLMFVIYLLRIHYKNVYLSSVSELTELWEQNKPKL